MHDYQTIRNKTLDEDDINDLFIGKKFDKYLKSEIKEAYEKASLEHEQSKHK